MLGQARFLCVAACVFLLSASRPPAAAQTPGDVLDDQALQRIDIYVHTRDWARLRADYQLNTHYPADLRWRGVTVRNASIRSRGGWSRSGTKPSLLVEFGRYVGGQTFAGLDSLVLKNLTEDASAIREFLGMKLLRRLGVAAPRGAFAALYVNNTFMGLYAIVENIGTAAMRRMFGDDAGYLYEFDWTDYPAEVVPYYFPYAGPDPSAYAVFFKPVTHQLESAVQLYSPIEEWARTVHETADEGFVEAVSKYMDVGAFIRHVGGQAYLAELDGLLGAWGMNNFFLYRPAGSTVHRFVAWDEDHACWALDFPLLAGHAENPIMRRLMQSEEIRTAYFAAILEAAALADEVEATEASQSAGARGPGWLEREAVRVLTQIGDTNYRDVLKPFTNDEFDQDAARVVAFTRQRGAWARCEVARLTGGSQDPSCAVVGAAASAPSR